MAPVDEEHQTTGLLDDQSNFPDSEHIKFKEFDEVGIDALEKYGIPDIFNTDQGSQYTFYEHTKLLIKNNIKISMDGN